MRRFLYSHRSRHAADQDSYSLIYKGSCSAVTSRSPCTNCPTYNDIVICDITYYNMIMCGPTYPIPRSRLKPAEARASLSLSLSIHMHIYIYIQRERDYRYCIVQYMVRYGTYGTVQYIITQYNILAYDMISQHIITQYIISQYIITQHIITQYSMVRHGISL